MMMMMMMMMMMVKRMLKHFFFHICSARSYKPVVKTNQRVVFYPLDMVSFFAFDARCLLNGKSCMYHT